jgi:hypothetical protein
MEMKMGKCLKCGVNVEEGSAFCESCGAAIQSIEDSQRENAIRDGIQRNGKQNTMTWSVDLPLLTSSIVVKQMLFVLIASSLFVLVFMLIVEAFSGDLTFEGFFNYLLFTLIILGILTFLAVIVMLIFYRNRYEYQFTLDETGVTAETKGGSRKKNAILNFLLIISHKPVLADSGLIAASRLKEKITWKKVDSIQSDEKKLEVILRCRGRAIMLIRCTPENYSEVIRRVNEAVNVRMK